MSNARKSYSTYLHPLHSTWERLSLLQPAVEGAAGRRHAARLAEAAKAF